MVEDDSSLFCDTSALGPTPKQEPISPELLWYLGHHPKEEDVSKSALEGLPGPPSEPCAGSRAMDIEWLLDTDSRQASTQTEPVDSLSPEPSSEDTSEDSSEDGLISVQDSVKPWYRVRAMGEAKKATLRSKLS